MLFRKVINKLKLIVAKLIRPTMIAGYKRYDGINLLRTRIGNTSYLGGVEHLNIKDNIFIGHYNFIDASNGIEIGEGCQITNFVSVLTHSSHVSIRLYGNSYTSIKNPVGYVKGAVSIGEYTFIGPHSVVMPGTKIGRGCIVAAFSFVKGCFPDFAIIAGNPAEIVGDTRELDREYLESCPELSKNYDMWAKHGGDF